MPNISIIDVSKIVEKLTEIITQMSRIPTIMARLSVIAGLRLPFLSPIIKSSKGYGTLTFLKFSA